MTTLKRLSASATLTLVLGAAAFADAPIVPCSPTDPGIMQTPPCATAQSVPDDSAAPGQTDSPPSTSDFSLAEIAVDVLQDVLMIF